MMGHFEPNHPISATEIREKGIAFSFERFCRPYIKDHVLAAYFKTEDVELVKRTYLDDVGDGV